MEPRVDGVVNPGDRGGSRRKAGRREWIGLAVLALPCVVYAMDLTVLNLAVPALTADLAPSGVQLLWIVDIYGFLVAGSLITMGTLGDRFGRKRVLLIGAAAFVIGSLLAACARGAAELIVARALLGVAGATLAPSTLSLIRNMFLDDRERSLAIGVWISSYSAGGAIGPLVGGLLLQQFWWGSVFLIGVPVMVLLLLLGPALLPEFKDPFAGRPDPASALLSLVSILGTIYGIKQIAENGVSLTPVAAIAGGLALGLVFLGRQRTLADPLIDLRLLSKPAFAVPLATYTLATFVGFGAFVFIAQYLQLVLDLSPLAAGLWTIPFAGSFILGSLLTPAMTRRARPAFVIAGGLAVAAIGFTLLSRVTVTSGLSLLVTAFVVYSLGLAPVFTLATDMIVGAAPPERAGVAAALSETGSELGGALGIAILGSVGTALYRSAVASAAPSGVPASAVEAARNTLGAATEAARALPGAAGGELLMVARTAFAGSLRLAATLCAALMVVAAILTLTLLGRERAIGRER